MGHYDNCRPGYCGKCGAGPGNMRVDGSCPFCTPNENGLQLGHAEPLKSVLPDGKDLRKEWSDAFRAFVGAFDTPVARRKQDDEYARDARRRLCVFDASFQAFMKENFDERN